MKTSNKRAATSVPQRCYIGGKYVSLADLTDKQVEDILKSHVKRFRAKVKRDRARK
jgi:hypothetical protein